MFALHGAEKRLLPAPVAAVLFSTALLFQPLAWGLMALFAPDLADVALPGLGPSVAVIHALTAGVLLPVAMGAMLQILCVVTMQAPLPRGRLLPMAVLLSGGASGLVAGAAGAQLELFTAAVAALAAAVLVFAFDFARLLRGARQSGFPDSRAALGVALASLAGLAVLAVALAVDAHLGWMPDHSAAALAHALLAAFGFMGFLAVGFSLILLPMLAIAEPPASGRAAVQIGLGAAGLAVAVVGVLAEIALLAALGGALGLAAAVLHVRLMETVLKKRLRRKLGDAFILVRLAWAMMLAALVLGILLALGVVPVDPGAKLFGIVLLHGWLFTLVGGLLQRILPFLASMHVMAATGRAVSPAKLSLDVALRIHLVGHCAALALAIAAALSGYAPLFAAAGLAGLAGGVAFTSFAVVMTARTLSLLPPSCVPQEAK